MNTLLIHDNLSPFLVGIDRSYVAMNHGDSPTLDIRRIPAFTGAGVSIFKILAVNRRDDSVMGYVLALAIRIRGGPMLFGTLFEIRNQTLLRIMGFNR